jgi:prevent-host-death family protein
MGAYSIAEAKAQLSALIEQVERGEAVTLTKRGKPVARIVSLVAPAQKPKIDLDELRRFHATMPKSKMNSAEMIRKMRDEEDGW